MNVTSIRTVAPEIAVLGSIVYDGGSMEVAQYAVSDTRIGDSAGYASVSDAVAALTKLTRGDERPGAFVVQHDGRYLGYLGQEATSGDDFGPMNIEDISANDPSDNGIFVLDATGAVPVAAMVDGTSVARVGDDPVTLPKGSFFVGE